jgi:hypothetical protein
MGRLNTDTINQIKQQIRGEKDAGVKASLQRHLADLERQQRFDAVPLPKRGKDGAYVRKQEK